MRTRTKKTTKSMDFWIFITVMLLLSLGIIMVFSASAAKAYIEMDDAYYFFKKQLIYSLVGVVALLIASKIDYRKLGKLSVIMLIISLLMLVMLLIPGLGRTINGSTRWLKAPIPFQPSEIAKISIILFYSYSLSKHYKRLEKFWTGLLPYILLMGVFAALFIKQPHMSVTIIVFGVVVILLFCAGAKIWHFIVPALVILPAGIYLIMSEEYRMKRVFGFLNPWEDMKDTGWQIVNSLYAIGSGGIFGRGLGKSLQKFLYLPEPHNDFIFSVLAEEMGFVGCVTVLVLFMVFIWRGIKVAINAPDMFGSLVATGITSLVAIQVLVNVAVVSGSVPVTGMPLPFFSAGGTSVIILLFSIGILLNISKHAKYEKV